LLYTKTGTWTLRAVNQKHLESFEMWFWKIMEKVSWAELLRYEEILLEIKEQRNILHEISKRKTNWMVIYCVETAFYSRLLMER
jgi:hypothetical protein